MAKLGKCLAFYLRHTAEMDRLYAAADPKTEGLPEPDRVFEMAQAVGDAASGEAAELLEECGLGVEQQLGELCTLERASKRWKVEKNWDIGFRIRTDADSKRAEFFVGVYLSPSLQSLIPWIWSHGRSRGAEAAAWILGSRCDCHFREYGLSPGTIALRRVLIPVQATEDVESQPLVEQVVSSFKELTKDDIGALLDV